MPNSRGLKVVRRAGSDLRDGASDLEAFVLVVLAGLRAVLVSGQLQLLWVELHHRLLVHFDVRNQRLQSKDERGRCEQISLGHPARFSWSCLCGRLVQSPGGTVPSVSQW